MSLPDRSTLLRLRRLGLTQAAIARVYGVSRPAVSAALQPPALYPPRSVLETWRKQGRTAGEVREMCERFQVKKER